MDLTNKNPIKVSNVIEPTNKITLDSSVIYISMSPTPKGVLGGQENVLDERNGFSNVDMTTYNKFWYGTFVYIVRKNDCPDLRR